jgi:catechol 2,3-dioxygenase-like lactoylglutathione lyase family enzyme
MRFYGETLGMTVSDVFEGHALRGRHVFVRPGESTAWGLHFFDTPDAEVFPSPWPPDPNRFIPGALQHIAFALPDETAGLALRARLEASGVPLTPVNTIGPLRNFLFNDNNGYLLEAAWPRGELNS